MSVTTLPREKILAREAQPVVKPAGRELELKFLVSEPGFRASQGWPALASSGARRAVRVRSFYYDTPGGALHQHGMALRMRPHRRGFVMTLKYDGGFPGGMFERGEVEVFCASSAPEPALLGAEFAAAIADAAAGEALVLAYETDIRRITHLVATAASAVEVAFDAGHIIAGGVKTPVREIELELKAGEPAALFELGIELAEKFPVRLGTLAKSECGYLALTRTAPAVTRANPALAPTVSVDEAMFCVLGDCLAHFLGNFAAFESGDDVNAIHQMRVALRRLRAMLGMFGRAFPCAAFARFREEAKVLATAMNDARNLDVFMALVRDGPLQVFADEAGLEAIIAACRTGRAAEYERIKTLLAAPATTRFVLGLQSALQARVWRSGLSAEALGGLTAPARDFAGQMMSRQHRKIIRQGGKALRISPHERHELRIQIKKLRYAAESFAGVMEAKKPVRAYVKAAARLQDALGSFNDLVTARGIVESLAARETRAAGMILGWCARGAVQDEALVEDWRGFRREGMPF